MAKKDTYLALLRRGVDEVTAQTLADAGVTIGGLKKMNSEQLIGNYGLKKEVASRKTSSQNSSRRRSGSNSRGWRHSAARSWS